MAEFRRIVYKCPICGHTSQEYNAWKPCEKESCYVCTSCCSKCEYHKSWSGLHECTYDSELKRLLRKRDNGRHKIEVLEKKMDSPHAYNSITYRVRIWEQLEDTKATLQTINQKIAKAQADRESAWANSEYIRRETCSL